MLTPRRAVFFDLDNTLYSYAECIERTLRTVHAREADLLPARYEAFRDAYHAASDETAEVDHALIFEDLAEYRRRVFGRMFRRLGVTADGRPERLRPAFEEARLRSMRPFPGATETLRAVGDHATVGIITNGPSELQWSKVEALGLLDLVDRNLILVSGDLAPYRKPDAYVFEHAATRAGVAPPECTMVGDSMECDMPAKAVGWSTIHFRGVPPPADDVGPFAPDDVAHSWDDVRRLLVAEV